MNENSANIDRFKALVSAISDVVYRLSPDWSIMYELDGRGFLKSTSAPITGWKQRNVHPDDMDMVDAAIARSIAEKTTFELEHRVLRVDGSTGWTLSRALPILNEIGEIVEWFGVAADISARKHAELELHTANKELQLSQTLLNEANVNLALIINMLPASVVVIRGDDLIIEMINDSNLIYWGKSREQVLGRRFLDVLPDLANQPFAGQLRRVMQTGEIIDVKESPVLFTMADGSLRETFVDYTYQPLQDSLGNTNRVLVMSFEITDRVKSRQLLEQYTEALGNLNESLSEVNDSLVKSEKRFKYFIEEAPVAIGVLQGQQLILETANSKILEVWGKNTDIIGLPLALALPELNGQPFLEILDHVFATGISRYVNEINAFLQHDGEVKELFFNVAYQAVSGLDGAVSDILIVAADVTEQVNARKAMEETMRHFRDLADLVPAKISNIQPNGEVTFYNQQWLDFAGMDFEALQSFGYDQMIHPDEVDGFHNGLQKAATERRAHIAEMRFKNRHGEYIWHLNVVSPSYDEYGNLKMWVGSTTDVQALKEEDQRKMDFVSMLSHELKTPITSIKAHVQMALRLLGRETNTPSMQKLNSSFDRIDKLLVQLTSMISDMLDLSRLDAGRMDLSTESFAIDALIQEIVDDFRISNPQHVFDVTVHATGVINADRGRIGQVLINLIANSIKYSPNSKKVDIDLSTANNRVQIAVRDYGIGIEQKEQQRIFERFYRVDGKNEKFFGGFGIGLFLAHGIVTQHGGTISVESEVGGGTTFRVHLLLNSLSAGTAITS